MDNFMMKTYSDSDDSDVSNLYRIEGGGMKLDDKVNHPAHYNKGTIETYDYIVDTLGEYEAISYCQGNIIKYISRMWHKKKPLEDLSKAKWYLEKLISLHDNDTS